MALSFVTQNMKCLFLQAFVSNSVQRLQLYMKQLNIAVQESNAQVSLLLINQLQNRIAFRIGGVSV